MPFLHKVLPGRTRALKTRVPIALPAILITLAALLSPQAASARQGGRIMGITTDGRTAAPLTQVQIYLVGTSLGTLSGNNGRYILLNVPAGTYQLRAERIGYAPLSRELSIRADEVTTLDLALELQALGLDEIVVTGTAGAARRREVGNSIAQIRLAEVAAPVANVDQLLQSRAPGMVVTESSGMAGSGSQIRLRGSVSVSQSNQPLIYIDGIRVKSDAYQKNVPPGDFDGRSGNVTASPLSDINPQDIDRVEIIKGSAATTLYGTEAAAGVIQIFTRRGLTGAPRWSMQVTQGFNRLMPFAPEPRPFLNIDEYTRRNDALNFLPGTGVGLRQGYALSVNGGGEALQYFASANFDRSEGVLPLDEESKIGVRGNFTFTPLNNLQLTWNTSYATNSITNTPAGNNAHGLTLNAFRQEQNYFSNGAVDTVRQVLAYDINTWIDRFITGATAVYAPTANLNHRLTVGYDHAAQENRNVRGYGFRIAPTGIISDQRYTNTTLTLDYVGSYRWQASGDIASTFSFGGQSVTSEEINTIAKGEELPGPGEPTVSNAAKRDGYEERLRVINAGFFGQVLLDFKNRYFLTAGMRVDGNSAFGKQLGLQAYPKASLAYVISDEEFWPESLGQVKLRLAYGQSGRAPGAFDAVKTWNTPGLGGQPAFLPRNLGNEKLGPERTGEIEVGFDGSFLESRLSTEFTYYHRKTTDALFAVRRAQSYGDVSSQLMNVGALQNKGIELGLNAVVLDRERWGLDLGGSIYTNQSEVLDLGGADEFAAGGGWIKVGAPVMAIRAHMITNPREKADPKVVRDTIWGPQQPTLVLGINTTLRLPGQVTLTARGEYQGGGYIEDGASSNSLQRAVRWPTCTNAYGHLEAGRGADLTAWERKLCIQANYENNFLVYPKDFFKLRDVTLQVPANFLIPGASTTTFALSLRNWYTWKNKDFPIFDPEMVGNSGFGSQNTSITEHIPPTASLVASLRINF
jgi:outer membrane receptor for ferrienterochelin and colicin